MTAFKRRGGARIGAVNATYPLATLAADKDALVISCLGFDYKFPRTAIQRLTRHRGLFSTGLCIEHTLDSQPEFVVFWASIFFSTSGFRRLAEDLEKLGYEIEG